MRLNGNHLSTTDQRTRSLLPSSRWLVALGYAGAVYLALTGALSAQVTTAPAPAATGSTAAGNSQGQNSPDQSASDQLGQTPALLDQNAVDQSRAQVPPLSQNPANPTPTNIPQFPPQPGNPISPYNSSSANPQSPQLTAPSLYLTGANDLNRISTGAALSQAFTEQGASGFYSEPVADYDHPPIERIRLGPFDLRAAVVTGVVGDDNLRTGSGSSGGSGGSKGDVSYGITPAILLQYGDHDGQKGFASLVYNPTFTRYIHHSGENTDDYQNIAFNALYPFQRLTLNLTQTYTQTTGVNTDSNVRTTQTSSLSLIGATYEVDDKISTSTQLQEVITKFGGPSGQGGGGGEGEDVTTLNNNATYRLSQKLTVGPSLNLGIDKAENLSQQTFEQGLLGFNYAPTEKIGLYLQGGAELRQYEHIGTKVNPIFSAGVGYTPFDSTVMSLNASQSIHTDTNTASTSATNDTVVSTEIGATITQRIVQRVFVSFDFDYAHSDDQAGTGGTGSSTASTSQDTLTYRPSLKFAPTGWSSFSLYYQYLSNESNMSGSSYNDNQVGLSLTAQF